MQKTLFFFVSLVVFTHSFAQDSLLQRLKMDTTFAFLQYKNPALIESLQRQLNNSDSDKFVIYHFGGSHIQAGMPPNVVRKSLQKVYGNGGPGMIFSYKAADTYSSVNYTSTKTGNWIFGKSYQGNPKVPLGVCGMGVETVSPTASLGFLFKQQLPTNDYFVRVFVESDSLNRPFQLKINDQVYQQHQFTETVPGSWQLAISGSIDSLFVVTDAVATNKRFRFYGIDIEHQKNSGIVYHSLGVGAAAFRSVLQLEKLTDHSKVLLPDMVLLDFGTNDILYTNAIDKKLPATVEKAIAQFRAINPNIFIVLTSTQDLYKNGKYITAGVEFVELMDSLAQKNDCFFWNWYDLAGGYGTINTWKQEKYAKSDGIHLTAAGYQVKGEWLFRSFQNSLQFGQAYPDASCLIPMKGFPVKPETAIDTLQIPIEQPIQRPLAVERQRYYTVRSGDTLGEIAHKHGVSISALKRANGLRSDVLQIGKRLKIPK